MRLVDLVHHLFVSTFGGEDIDNLPEFMSDPTRKRADFLLFDGSVVVEMKEFVADRIEKIRKIIDFHRRLSDWPPMPDGTWLQDLLAAHPRGAEINAELRDANTQSVEKTIRDANGQIRATKVAVGREQAVGLLALVNERVDVLDPIVIAGTVHHLLRKRNPSGSLRYPSIDLVVIFTTAHFVVGVDGVTRLAILSMCRHDDPRGDELKALAHRVMEA